MSAPITTFHRWALLDRAGKTRGTTTSPAGATLNAEAKLVTQRKGRGIPPGWRIVDRGPVKAREPKAPEHPKLVPSAFKVGDSIRLLEPHWLVKEGTCAAGTVAKLEHQGGGKPVRFYLSLRLPVSGSPCQFTPGEYTTAEVEHIPAALARTLDPQAEKLLVEARETIRQVAAERDQAREMLAATGEAAERRRLGLDRVREFFEAFGVPDLDEAFANMVQVDGCARGFGARCKCSADKIKAALNDASRICLPQAIQDIMAERRRQDGKWGGPEHDDQLTPLDWHEAISDYNGWARRMLCMGSLAKGRRRLIQVAALALAEVEALDRRASAPQEVKP